MADEKKSGYPSIDKPWLKYYSKEAVNDPIPDTTIYEYLLNNNIDYPDDIAISYFGKTITYKELFQRIDEAAAGFRRLHTAPGEIVTVALPSIPEALIVVYAINKIGAVANMIHPLAGEQELVNYLNEVHGRVAVLFEGTYEILRNSLCKTTVEQVVVVSAGESMPFWLKRIYSLKKKQPSLLDNPHCISWKSFLVSENGKEPVFKKDPEDLALISHTGGTTGDPKGVMLSDKSINAIIWQLLKSTRHERQQHFLVQLPPFINYSLVNSMLEPLACGVILYLVPDYKPDKIGRYLKQFRPNHINSIPPYLEAMLQDKTIRNLDLSFLMNVSSGGDGLTVESEERINRLLSARGASVQIAKGYGMTELVSCATFTYEGSNEVGSIGIPLVKMNCKVIDPDSGEELTYGELGEVCFTGDSVMLGYYNNPEATADLISEDSQGNRWVHTGDIGYISKDGLVFLSGRIKRILITKGTDGVPTKLFPDRIERVANKHPEISLCCAIGILDEARVNYPVLFVVLENKENDRQKITEELYELFKKELPDYMIPERIEFKDSLPRTDRGKIDYRALEAQSE